MLAGGVIAQRHHGDGVPAAGHLAFGAALHPEVAHGAYLLGNLPLLRRGVRPHHCLAFSHPFAHQLLQPAVFVGRFSLHCNGLLLIPGSVDDVAALVVYSVHNSLGDGPVRVKALQ
ncbi:hypothetical protein D3C81_1703330 [compost metagenome]